MPNYYKLYSKVDRDGNTEFVGTMKELCEYTGLVQNTIRSFISHCKKNNKFCPYVCLGSIFENETEEERKERYRGYTQKYIMRSVLKGIRGDK